VSQLARHSTFFSVIESLEDLLQVVVDLLAARSAQGTVEQCSMT
jgi:hypothetical protein